eukprot:CAMPEP_0113472244 /NCGR_PEP_ID=MMETSP0014_2-20120614/17410_1 /TAXON_ID=2857 /ORGANISM="Nitzschia sp." /LENGTH=174 /DNA_ID=CAMNT_0000364937 /DNA_START=136 /DNA_END=660 /DNA_ORIENTATION=+ /assembly_acc=CAM_ASM_000159
MASTAIGINNRTHEITSSSSFDARAQIQQEVKNNGAKAPTPVAKIEDDENEEEETCGGGDDDRRECESDDDHQARNIQNDSSNNDQAATNSHVLYLTEVIQQLIKEKEQYQEECTALKRTVETLKITNTKRELRSMKALKQMRRQIDVLEVEKRRWYATQRRLEDEIGCQSSEA